MAGNGALINSSSTVAGLAGTITSTSGTYTLGGSGNFNLSGGASGTLTMNGIGTLTLSGSSDNSGLGVIVNNGTVILAKSSSGSAGVHAVGGTGLMINGGIVQLGGTGGDQIYDGSDVSVTADGEFDMEGQSETIHQLTLSAATSTDPALLLNSGAGTSTLTAAVVFGRGSRHRREQWQFDRLQRRKRFGPLSSAVAPHCTLNGVNTYSGGTSVFTGTLQTGSATALGSTSGQTTVSAGATLDLNGQTLGKYALDLSSTGIGGAGALINGSSTAASLAGNITSTSTNYSVGGSGAITLTGDVQKSLTKIGSNTLTLGGSVDNVGLYLTVNSGTVILAKSSSHSPDVHAVGGTITINGGTVQLGRDGRRPDIRRQLIESGHREWRRFRPQWPNRNHLRRKCCRHRHRRRPDKLGERHGYSHRQQWLHTRR